MKEKLKECINMFYSFYHLFKLILLFGILLYFIDKSERNLYDINSNIIRYFILHVLLFLYRGVAKFFYESTEINISINFHRIRIALDSIVFNVLIFHFIFRGDIEVYKAAKHKDVHILLIAKCYLFLIYI